MLSLRKTHLENLINSKRNKRLNIIPNQAVTLEIDPAKLNINNKFLANGIKSYNEDCEVLSNMLEADDENYIKFAVYNIRQYEIKRDNTDLRKYSEFEKYLLKKLGESLEKSEDESLIVNTILIIPILILIIYSLRYTGYLLTLHQTLTQSQILKI